MSRIRRCCYVMLMIGRVGQSASPDDLDASLAALTSPDHHGDVRFLAWPPTHGPPSLASISARAPSRLALTSTDGEVFAQTGEACAVSHPAPGWAETQR